MPSHCPEAALYHKGEKKTANAQQHSAHADAPPPPLPACRADDLGFHNIGWRNDEMNTPNLDALAADGIKLDRHYTFIYCSPSVGAAARRPGCGRGSDVHARTSQTCIFFALATHAHGHRGAAFFPGGCLTTSIRYKAKGGGKVYLHEAFAKHSAAVAA